MPVPTDDRTYDLGDLELQSGATLRGARLSYQVYGELAGDRSNVVLAPTWYSSRHTDNEWLLGSSRPIDPAHHFVIIPNMLGNGMSSSPSTTPAPHDGPRFPAITFVDQVAAQHRLLTEHFGVESLELVVGPSMGAGQTYQWAVSHPEMVKRAAPIVGAPKTSEHNRVFLAGLAAALTADGVFAGGDYDQLPVTGLKAMARVYAGWGFSQAFYWNREYRTLGFETVQDFLTGFWEGFFLDDRDPNNLLTMIDAWDRGDVGNSPGFGGDTEAALRSIRCPLVAMPCRTDLYFPPEDEQHWSVSIPHGRVQVIDSTYGHFAGLGADPAAVAQIDQALAELLKQ